MSPDGSLPFFTYAKAQSPRTPSLYGLEWAPAVLPYGARPLPARGRLAFDGSDRNWLPAALPGHFALRVARPALGVGQ